MGQLDRYHTAVILPRCPDDSTGLYIVSRRLDNAIFGVNKQTFYEANHVLLRDGKIVWSLITHSSDLEARRAAIFSTCHHLAIQLHSEDL